MQFANIGLPEVTIVLPRLAFGKSKVFDSSSIVVVLALKVMTFQAFFLALLFPTVLYYDSSIRKTKLLPYFYSFFSSFPPFGAILWGPSLYFEGTYLKFFGEVGKSLVFQTTSSSYNIGDCNWIETCFFSI